MPTPLTPFTQFDLLHIKVTHCKVSEETIQPPVNMEKGTASDKLNPEEVSTPDDEEEMIGTRPCNPFENASCMSKLFFTWPQKLLQEGLIKPIEERDLPGK